MEVWVCAVRVSLAGERSVESFAFKWSSSSRSSGRAECRVRCDSVKADARLASSPVLCELVRCVAAELQKLK